MRQGGCTLRRDSPKTILGQMGYRETQSSCPSHERISVFAAPHGSEPLRIPYPALRLLAMSNITANSTFYSASIRWYLKSIPAPFAKWDFRTRYGLIAPGISSTLTMAGSTFGDWVTFCMTVKL